MYLLGDFIIVQDRLALIKDQGTAQIRKGQGDSCESALAFSLCVPSLMPQKRTTHLILEYLYNTHLYKHAFQSGSLRGRINP